MSVMDNEGHDPNGLFNQPSLGSVERAYNDGYAAARAEIERLLEQAQKDADSIQRLIKYGETRQTSLEQIARMRLMPDDKVNRVTLHAAIEVAKLHVNQQSPSTEKP